MAYVIHTLSHLCIACLPDLSTPCLYSFIFVIQQWSSSDAKVLHKCSTMKHCPITTCPYYYISVKHWHWFSISLYMALDLWYNSDPKVIPKCYTSAPTVKQKRCNCYPKVFQQWSTCDPTVIQKCPQVVKPFANYDPNVFQLWSTSDSSASSLFYVE